MLLSEDADPAGKAPPGFVRRSVELPVRDEVLRIVCDVPARPMRLAEIVPFVRDVDDRLMAIYLRQAAAQQLTIHCRKGCDACCHRYLVVFSPAEMYYQMEFIHSLPGPRRQAVLQWLTDMAAEARQSGLIDRLTSAGPEAEPLKIIEKWWLDRSDGTCIFLADGACGIHPQRFIACREHYSHSPPECCANIEISRMPTPLTLINTLWQLEQALTGETGGVLSLPMMKLWADVRTAEAQRTWPAVEMVEKLFAIFTTAAAEAQRLRASATVQRGPDVSGG